MGSERNTVVWNNDDRENLKKALKKAAAADEGISMRQVGEDDEGIDESLRKPRGSRESSQSYSDYDDEPEDRGNEIAVDHQTSKRKRKRRRKKRPLLKLLIFLIICGGVYYGMSSDYFKIRNIEVKGSVYYTKEEVLNLADAKTGGNLFFSSNKKAIISKLSANPYFNSVEVKRKLPDTLQIVIEERKQIAAVKYSSGYLVVDKNGILLRKGDIDPKVTVIEGVILNKVEDGRVLEVSQKDEFKEILKLIQATVSGDFFFKKIVLKDECEAYINDSFVVVGKASDITKAVEKGKLQKVVNNLFRQNINSGTIKIGDFDYISYKG